MPRALARQLMPFRMDEKPRPRVLEQALAHEVSVESTAGGRFESILKNFEYSLQGYRLFLDQLHGQIKDSYQEELKARMDRIVDGLEPTDRASVLEGLDSFLEFFGSSVEEETANEGEENGSASVLYH